MVNPCHIVSTMSPILYRIPKQLEMIHAYHPHYHKLIDHNFKLGIESLKQNETTKIKLLVKQKGKCVMCGESLLNSMGEFMYDDTTNIHHVQFRSKGGSKNKLNNLVLEHQKCHNDVHRNKGL